MTGAPVARPGGQRRHVRAWCLALGVAAGASLWYAAARSPVPFRARSGMSQGTAEYPVVRVAVNEHLRRVAQQSTYRFDFANVVDVSSKTIDEPVAFEYAGEGGSAFRLAPVGFVALGQSGGWVYNITVAPQAGSKPLAEAYSTARVVDSVLAGTRWRRMSEPLPTLDQIRRDWRDSEWGGEAHGLGQWQFGTAELTVTLKRSAEQGERTLIPGRRLAEDLYFVEVNVYDGTRLNEYDARLLAIREARQHGDARRALPLNSVLDDPMPVPTVPPAGTSPR